MKMAAQKLNLKPHLCGTDEEVVELYSAIDVEGHKGKGEDPQGISHLTVLAARFTFFLILR